MQSFNGGIADEAFGEPHAGYTFCSLGCLNFTDRLRIDPSTTQASSKSVLRAPADVEALTRWLVHRQTDLINPDAQLDSEFIGAKPHTKDVTAAPLPIPNSKDKEPVHQSPDKTVASVADFLAPSAAGMNGRTNKVADTCYCWWTAASLHILHQPQLYERNSLDKYLLEKTQHPVLGGFGKFPCDLPDLYHSYLGLATLSLSGIDGVREVDAGMCISRAASVRLKGLWKSWGL